MQTAAGHQVGSVFSSLKSAGLGSAMFAAKPKFTLFNRSWPQSIDHTLIRADNTDLVKAARRDLATTWRALTFLHISLPDVAGHAHGWMSPAYLTAVRQSDDLIGRVLATIRQTPESRDHTLVMVTADHGGLGPSHADPRAMPTTACPSWSGVPVFRPAPTSTPSTRRTPTPAPAASDTPRAQPVRNGDVGNLVLDVLGLPAIPHSELDDGTGPRRLRPP